MTTLANDIFDKERFGLVTASRCSVMFSEKGTGLIGMATYAKQLANQMYWNYYDENGTWQTEHGNLCEPMAFDHLQNRFGSFLLEIHPKFIRNGNIGGSADCVDFTAQVGFDFKCPTSLEKWLDYLHNGIDKQQYYQMQMYMHLYNFDSWYVCAYLCETDKMSNNGLVYPVPEQDRMIMVKVERDSTFAERMQKPLEYIISKRDEYYQKLVNQFGTR